MNVTVMKVCAWSGVAVLVALGVGFWPLAHFIPPPAPNWSAAHTARFFLDHRDGIRFGMILSMISAALFAPFTVAITLQMRRMEGTVSPLALIQLVLGTLFILEVIYLCFFWETATFRDRAPALIVLLNDMGWIPFVGLISTLFMEIAVFALAILLDRRPRPVMPRWSGYFNLWVAMAYVVGAFNVFFKTGPLAWNGILAFYVPVAVFAVWLVVNSWLLARAVGEHAAELEANAVSDGGGADGEIPAAVAAELASMRRELERVLG